MSPDTPRPPESNQPSPSSPTKEVLEEEEEEDHPQPKRSEEESNAAAPGDRKKSGSSADDDPDGQRTSEVLAPREAAARGAEMSESGATAERLRRHRMEMGGRVWIPEMWGHEGMLKEWIDSSVFDRFLVPKGLLSARDALVVEGCRRRTPATGR